MSQKTTKYSGFAFIDTKYRFFIIDLFYVSKYNINKIIHDNVNCQNYQLNINFILRFLVYKQRKAGVNDD